MKKLRAAILMSVLFVLVLACFCYFKSRNSAWNRVKNPETVQMLKRFVAMKKAQAYAATNGVPAEIQVMFKYAERGDWQALSNSFNELKERNIYWDSLGYGTRHWHGFRGAVEDFLSDAAEKFGCHWEAKAPLRPQGTSGETIMEVYGALDGFVTGDEKYSTAFGRDIIASIPPGSIYFGGTDPGRFIVTAMCKSQPDADPFFTLTQNALADGTYLDYLRSMYGKIIYIPTQADSQKSFQDYMTDAQHRLSHDQQLPNEPRQLKPGEGVRQDSNGRIQVNGQMSVIGIRDLLTKTIFDKNPDREFYIEESFPLDWMYPNLEPHGLIMKINRQQLPELSDKIVQRDSDYWTKYVTPMIGGWLNNDTTVKEVAAFAEKIHVKKDLSGFTGDPQFVHNEYSCKMFSKLRSSIAGLYAWRAQHATDPDEKERMNGAADFAFRQAFALCPYSPEAVYRYVNLLLSENRTADAILVAETAAKMPQEQDLKGEQMRSLVTQLKQFQKTK